MKRIRSLRFRSYTVPLALLLLCIGAFGILLPTLGYYWDDWAKILVSRLHGLSGYWAYYAEDRPYSAWTHIVFTAILGARPLAWQIFQFVLIWLSAWAMYWALSRLWPRMRWHAAAVALLFVVYPAFQQQPVSLTFHQQWLQYLFYLLSLGCMIQAVRRPERALAWTALSLLLAAGQLLVTEYFAPLELLRPLLLWLLVAQVRPGASLRQRLVDTLRRYAPYAVGILIYGVWRLFFIQLSGDDPYKAETLYGLISQPIPTLANLARVMVQDSLSMLVSTWAPVFTTGRIDSFSLMNAMILVVSAALGVAVFVYLLRLEQEPYEDERKRWVVQAALVGLVAVFLGASPAWLTGREVVWDFHSDRYAMPALFGASLLWVACLEWIAPGRAQKAALLGLMIGLAGGYHLHTAADYRRIWQNQLSVYWQLYWRAPAVAPGTALMFEDEPFPNQGLFSTSAAINLLYPQPEDRQDLAYWVYVLKPRFENPDVDPLSLGFHTQFRTLVFNGGSPNVLLFSYNPGLSQCVWLLSPDDVTDPTLSGLLKRYLPASNPALVSSDPAGWVPPADMFGAEPAHQWCYYYQKADLARQLGDWEQVAALQEEAHGKGYAIEVTESSEPREWMPFLEADLHLGRLEEANQLTSAIYAIDPVYQAQLCSIWQRASDGAAPPSELECAP
ncbi:MAG: hypothetical protein GYA17_14010 [Chloroflexi bacterium]|nr:hypothetical protein [Chloroflexota bacterium]